VTASTTLFGAPFWFDILQRAVQMRATGSKPDERPPVVAAVPVPVPVQPVQPVQPAAAQPAVVVPAA
jgi:hypothetical protein